MTDKVTYLRDVYNDQVKSDDAERRRLYAEGISIANQLDGLIEECHSLGERALACGFRLIVRRLARREEHGLAEMMLLRMEIAARELRRELNLPNPVPPPGGCVPTMVD